MNKPRGNPVNTRKKTVVGWIAEYYSSLVHPPQLGVKLGGSKGEVYPSMTKGEIRYVARSLCQNAKKSAR